MTEIRAKKIKIKIKRKKERKRKRKQARSKKQLVFFGALQQTANGRFLIMAPLGVGAAAAAAAARPSPSGRALNPAMHLA
jgi:hypothetical protein